jgi:hypothetical protein
MICATFVRSGIMGPLQTSHLLRPQILFSTSAEHVRGSPSQMVHNKTSLDGGVAFGTWFRLGSRAGFISCVAGMRGPISYICYV